MQFESNFDKVNELNACFWKNKRCCVPSKSFCIVFQDVIEDLKALGQKEKPAKRIFTVVNAVEKEDGCINAVSDLRKLGEPAGY